MPSKIRLMAIYYSTHVETGKLHAAKQYNAIARKIKKVNPNSVAINVANMALMTEAQPLMPQAQGINAGVVWLILANPIGNGMPMQKPSGAIKRMEKT